MAQEGNVLELVVYRLNEGVSRQQFLETNPPVGEWIAQQPGFISRDCVYDAEGDRWVDVIWWRSGEEAAAASEASLTSDSCAPMFALIDLESMLMLHGNQALPTVVPSRSAVGV